MTRCQQLSPCVEAFFFSSTPAAKTRDCSDLRLAGCRAPRRDRLDMLMKGVIVWNNWKVKCAGEKSEKFLSVRS